MRLSRPWYRSLWCLVVAVHLFLFAAYGYEVKIYIGLAVDNSYYAHAWQNLGVYVDEQHEVFLVMIATDGLIACWHLTQLALAIGFSIQHRRLLFAIPRIRARPHAADEDGGGSSLKSCGPTGNAIIQRMLTRLTRAWASVSLDGERFDVLNNARELVEISTQLFLVYRMSCFVPISWINHIAVTALVLNCWSTPMIRFALRRHRSICRLMQLLVDLWVSCCFTWLIPYAVFILQSKLLADTRWDDPSWVVTMRSMTQQILVVGWAPLISTRFAAFLAIMTIEAVKSKVVTASEPVAATSIGSRIRPLPTLPVALFSGSQPNRKDQVAVVWSTESIQHSNRRIRPPKRGPLSVFVRSSTIAPRGRLSSQQSFPIPVAIRQTNSLADWLFVATGIAALACHLHAGLRAQQLRPMLLGTCHLEMRPWLRSQYTCAVMELSCYELAVPGRDGDFDAALDTVDNALVGALTLSHCPQLEIPRRLHRLPGLLELELHNATLARWDRTAALTRATNPRLTMVYMSRIRNLSGLPEGLVVGDSPVRDLEIFDADLTGLPDDLHVTWSQGLNYLQLEYTLLTTLPTTLLAMDLWQLSLAGNKLRDELPEAFFTGRVLDKLSLSDTPLMKLPELTSVDARRGFIRELSVENTGIEVLPAWLAEQIRPSLVPIPTDVNSLTRVQGAHTSLCARLTASSSSIAEEPGNREGGRGVLDCVSTAVDVWEDGDHAPRRYFSWCAIDRIQARLGIQ